MPAVQGRGKSQSAARRPRLVAPVDTARSRP
jgi:hypothetical protein